MGQVESNVEGSEVPLLKAKRVDKRSSEMQLQVRVDDYLIQSSK